MSFDVDRYMKVREQAMLELDRICLGVLAEHAAKTVAKLAAEKVQKKKSARKPKGTKRRRRA
jgi:hypothetical protein